MWTECLQAQSENLGQGVRVPKWGQGVSVVVCVWLPGSQGVFREAETGDSLSSSSPQVTTCANSHAPGQRAAHSQFSEVYFSLEEALIVTNLLAGEVSIVTSRNCTVFRSHQPCGSCAETNPHLVLKEPAPEERLCPALPVLPQPRPGPSPVRPGGPCHLSVSLYEIKTSEYGCYPPY